MAIEELKERVEAAFNQRVAPHYHAPHGLPPAIAQLVRALLKLPFDNTSDPGV
jgi:hypothetical protein